MKKTINEKTLKSIIKESLKNYLKESMDSEIGMGEEAEGWTPEMDDMWDEFGNNNVHDTNGAFGVLAQGDDDDHVSRVAKSLRSTKFDTDANMGEFEDEADEFASDDNAEYLRDKMFESVVRKSVNETFNKNTNMGKTVKLTESELKNIISESVMNILKEGALGNWWNRTTKGAEIQTRVDNLQKVIGQFTKAINQAKMNNPNFNEKLATGNIQSLQKIMGYVQKGELQFYDGNGTQQAIKYLNRQLGTNIQLPSLQQQAAPQQKSQQAAPQQAAPQQAAAQQQPQQDMAQQRERVNYLMQGAREYAKELALYNKGRGGYNAFNDLKGQCKMICDITGENLNDLCVKLMNDAQASVY